MIDIHADDYALSLNTSEEILDLMHQGILDSISIIPNMSCYEPCIKRLQNEVPDLPFLPKLSVHLNLVEGISLCKDPAKDKVCLVDNTWGKLFISSYIPFIRKRTKNELKNEIREQLQKGFADIQSCIMISKEHGIPCMQKTLRIDSHQHSHLIPVVWSALTECLKEDSYDFEYIRNPREPLIPFLCIPSMWHSYRIINLIKNRVLYLLSFKVDRYNRNKSLIPMYMWGLVMSGKMDSSRICALHDRFIRIAKKNGRSLEILFHPGKMNPGEVNAEIPAASANSFYLNKNRDSEKEGALYMSSVIHPENPVYFSFSHNDSLQ